MRRRMVFCSGSLRLDRILNVGIWIFGTYHDLRLNPGCNLTSQPTPGQPFKIRFMNTLITTKLC